MQLAIAMALVSVLQLPSHKSKQVRGGVVVVVSATVLVSVVVVTVVVGEQSA